MITESRSEAEVKAEQNILFMRDNIDPQQLLKVEKFAKDAYNFFAHRVDNCDDYSTTMREMFFMETCRDYFNSLHGENYANTCKDMLTRQSTHDLVSKEDNIGINGVLSNRPDFANVIPFHSEKENLLSYENLAYISLFALCIPISTAGTIVDNKQAIESSEYSFSNVEYVPFLSNSLHRKLKTDKNYISILRTLILSEHMFTVYPDVTFQVGTKITTIPSKILSEENFKSISPQVFFERMLSHSKKEDEFYCKLTPPKMLKKPKEHISIAQDFLNWAKEMDAIANNG